jgi:tetratricopeptide (TPR) repeat protein
MKAKKELEPNQKSQLITQAMTQFEIAMKKEENAVSQTNLAASYCMKGMKTEARLALEKALTLSPDKDVEKSIMAMKGALEVRAGKYNDAVQSLAKANENYEVLFDLALANLLKGDLNAAMNGFEAAANMNQEGAAAYYGAAVTAARQGNEAKVISNLQKATSIDKAFAQRAVGDLEFTKYSNSDNFKQAIK